MKIHNLITLILVTFIYQNCHQRNEPKGINQNNKKNKYIENQYYKINENKNSKTDNGNKNKDRSNVNNEKTIDKGQNDINKYDKSNKNMNKKIIIVK